MKNLAKYEGEIGTTHWFRTLTSNAKHMGEYLENNADGTKDFEENALEYGYQIKNIISDLIEWQETKQPLKDEQYIRI